jgi:hypothetical protein
VIVWRKYPGLSITIYTLYDGSPLTYCHECTFENGRALSVPGPVDLHRGDDALLNAPGRQRFRRKRGPASRS